MAKKKTGKTGNIRERALGPSADNFGREIAPLGKEFGKVTVKVGRLLIGSLEGTVYGIEHVANWLRDAVAKRLKDKPPEEIVSPDPRIAVPATQALTYSMKDELIRDMFANLLAANMDAKLKDSTHPAFIETIKQLTPLEAQFVQLLSKKGSNQKTSFSDSHSSKWQEVGSMISPRTENALAATAIVNLERLGLIEIREEEIKGSHVENLIAEQENRRKVVIKMAGEQFVAIGSLFGKEEAPRRLTISYLVTPFGRNFMDVCAVQLPE